MGLFDFSGRRNYSSDYAKERLKLLLLSDRANCSPDILEQMKNDIMNVISRYLEIDSENMDIRIIQSESELEEDTCSILYANIPFKELNIKSIK